MNTFTQMARADRLVTNNEIDRSTCKEQIQRKPIGVSFPYPNKSTFVFDDLEYYFLSTIYNEIHFQQ